MVVGVSKVVRVRAWFLVRGQFTRSRSAHAETIRVSAAATKTRFIQRLHRGRLGTPLLLLGLSFRVFRLGDRLRNGWSLLG